MAKKRGRKKKNAPEAKNKHETPGGFWLQATALIVALLAVVIICSWFPGAGAGLSQINEMIQSVIGGAIYVLPLILIYLAVLTFRSDDNRIPASVSISSILVVLLVAGFWEAMGAAFPTVGFHGGVIGDLLGGFMIEHIDPFPSMLVFFVLIILGMLYVCSRTPADLFRYISMKMKSHKEGKEDDQFAEVAHSTRGKRGAAAAAADATPLPSLKIRGAEESTLKKENRRGLRGLKKDDKANAKPEAPAAKAEPSNSALVTVNDPDWKMPPLNLLDNKTKPRDPGNCAENAGIIQSTLAEFNIDVQAEGATIGPRVTQYTFRPPQGVKVSKIAQYDKNLALNLAVDKVRIEAPIPGTRLIGVEIPNRQAGSVGLLELLKSPQWRNAAAEKPLAFTVGKSTTDEVVVGNLAKMPHLLIAGTTGSGKSVMTNTLIMSLLYHNSPADLRLIIVDPKQVEMAEYNGIPHLLTPVITTSNETLSAFKWTVNEMERRYSLMAEKRVKNIVDYNSLIAKATTNESAPKNDDEGAEEEGRMPYIVVVVDEMADLMMTAGKELEALIVRIAQKGRAAGIHLVLATQRPEAKVVTGLIKANVPGRIAFAVNNNIDSRVMLDMSGAEKLLGSGDMLYLTTEMMGQPKRVQGAFVADKDITKVTNYLREQRPPQYNEEVISQKVEVGGGGGSFGGGDSDGADDELNYQAACIAVEARKLSTSLLGRRLHVGYGKASRALENLEEMGVIGPNEGGNRPREVLISSMDEYPGPKFD